jgi:hypothetical protein
VYVTIPYPVPVVGLQYDVEKCTTSQSFCQLFFLRKFARNTFAMSFVSNTTVPLATHVPFLRQVFRRAAARDMSFVNSVLYYAESFPFFRTTFFAAETDETLRDIRESDRFSGGLRFNMVFGFSDTGRRELCMSLARSRIPFSPGQKGREPATNPPRIMIPVLD